MSSVLVDRQDQVSQAKQRQQDLAELPSLLRRLYASRGVSSMDELQRDLPRLLPYQTLTDINKAADRLSIALKENHNVLIVGDFDTDGATSTALAVLALQAFGATHVDFLVPDRFIYGYGLSAKIVDAAAAKKPQLIITVDNGIASHAGVRRANELGIDVIITDHHLPSNKLPNAYAIVNPNQADDAFASKNLAGVGVIFYVMIALRAQLESINWFSDKQISKPNMAQFLDLVALGTVADVVPLDHNNRILVHQGIRRIRAGHARPGILAILEIAKRNAANLSSADLGYTVGPRLNAAGRLDDMSIGIQCLLARDRATALALADQLDQLNHERRALEGQMQQEAFAIIRELDLNNDLPLGLCLFDETWHQGIIGLVASRVKDKVHRPVIAFAKVDDATLKGSARSITNVHIRDLLESIATAYPDLLDQFGGHAMAAGLSLSMDNYAKFTSCFAEAVDKALNGKAPSHKLITDGQLDHHDFTFDTAQLLRDSGPWGQAFPEPVFDGEFIIINQRLVGQKHLKLVLQTPGSEMLIDAIAFNVDTDRWPNQRCESLRMLYRLDVNEYRGQQKLQLVAEKLL